MNVIAVNPQLLFHYTTLESLHKMIEGIKDYKMTFWASSIFAMNDPQEFVYGYDILKKLIEEWEDEYKVDSHLRISSLWNNAETPVKNLETELVEALHKQQVIPYIVSFSHEEDSLPLWNMYAGNGVGANLCFNSCFYRIRYNKEWSKIKEDDIILYNNLPVDDIAYEEYSEPKLDIMKKLYEKYLHEYQKRHEAASFIEKKKWLATLLIIFAPRIKNKAYAFEQESRYIEFQEDLSKTKFRTNARGHIVPYIEIEVPLDNLKYITIGPCADYQLAKMFLEVELRRKGVKSTNLIRKSKVPYRVY